MGRSKKKQEPFSKSPEMFCSRCRTWQPTEAMLNSFASVDGQAMKVLAWVCPNCAPLRAEKEPKNIKRDKVMKSDSSDALCARPAIPIAGREKLPQKGPNKSKSCEANKAGRGVILKSRRPRGRPGLAVTERRSRATERKRQWRRKQLSTSSGNVGQIGS